MFFEREILRQKMSDTSCKVGSIHIAKFAFMAALHKQITDLAN
jgi:hypothetical protein